MSSLYKNCAQPVDTQWQNNVHSHPHFWNFSPALHVAQQVIRNVLRATHNIAYGFHTGLYTKIFAAFSPTNPTFSPLSPSPTTITTIYIDKKKGNN